MNPPLKSQFCSIDIRLQRLYFSHWPPTSPTSTAILFDWSGAKQTFQLAPTAHIPNGPFSFATIQKSLNTTFLGKPFKPWAHFILPSVASCLPANHPQTTGHHEPVCLDIVVFILKTKKKQERQIPEAEKAGPVVCVGHVGTAAPQRQEPRAFQHTQRLPI